MSAQTKSVQKTEGLSATGASQPVPPVYVQPQTDPLMGKRDRDLIPKHVQIRTDIAAQIRCGELPPGARIPYEHELMLTYSCSRMTVNKALSGLSSAGLIERRKKAGSFVAVPEISAMVLDIPDLQAQTLARGETYEFRLLSQVASPGQLDIHGVHICAGRPLCVETRRIFLAAVPEARNVDFSVISPGTWLLQQVAWTQAENRISAMTARGETARLLGLDMGAACLCVDRHTWQNGQTITSVQQIFDGAHYHLIARF